MYEPCFYTHESNQGKKFKSNLIKDQFLTKDYIKHIDEEIQKKIKSCESSGKKNKSGTRNNS